MLTATVEMDLSLTAASDVMITGCLVYFIKRMERSDYETTNSLVDTILRNTIETNGLTAIVSDESVRFFAGDKDN